MSLLDDAKKEAYPRQTTSQKHTYFLSCATLYLRRLFGLQIMM